MTVRALWYVVLGFAEALSSSTSSGNRSWHFGGDFSVAVTGGTMNYYVITPALSEAQLYTDDLLSIETDKPVVILAHGLMRNRDDMIGHAKGFATAGFQVLVPQLLFLNINMFMPLNNFGIDHELNGKNLVELAHQAIPNRSQRKVIYAGQSAGGLAAVIAASTSAVESLINGGGGGVIENQNVVGLLGLDAVDTEDIGAKAIAQVSDETTAALLYGRSSACNARNNILPVFQWLKRNRAADGVRIEHFPQADHFDFENPASMLMNVVCSPSPFAWRKDEDLEKRLATNITDRAKDALLWMASQ
jgi:hypothetical protein